MNFRIMSLHGTLFGYVFVRVCCAVLVTAVAYVGLVTVYCRCVVPSRYFLGERVEGIDSDDGQNLHFVDASDMWNDPTFPSMMGKIRCAVQEHGPCFVTCLVFKSEFVYVFTTNGYVDALYDDGDRHYMFFSKRWRGDPIVFRSIAFPWVSEYRRRKRQGETEQA